MKRPTRRRETIGNIETLIQQYRSAVRSERTLTDEACDGVSDREARRLMRLAQDEAVEASRLAREIERIAERGTVADRDYWLREMSRSV